MGAYQSITGPFGNQPILTINNLDKSIFGIPTVVEKINHIHTDINNVIGAKSKKKTCQNLNTGLVQYSNGGSLIGIHMICLNV